MSRPDDYARVYLHSGRVTHLLSIMYSPSGGQSAACGVSPEWMFSWYGTGSQTEREKATVLPLCKRCANLTGVSE